MKCAVTGAAGFIGSSLCAALLDAGHDVVGIDAFTDFYPRHMKEANLRPAREYGTFAFTEGSLLTLDLLETLKDAELVFHLAAQAGVRSSWGPDFAVYSDNNILATQRLLEACRVTRPRRVVYASTSSVYGNAKQLPVAEDASPEPISPYGASKLAAEQLCRLYHSNFGVPTLILRYFTVYGPRQRPDMAFHRFMRAGIEGNPIQVYGDGTQTRDFTYISDVVAVTQAAGTLGQDGHVYNIGGGSRWRLNDILTAIERTINRPLRVTRLPVQPGDVRDTFADTSRARRDLLFNPLVTVTEGLINEAAWVAEALRTGLLSADLDSRIAVAG